MEKNAAAVDEHVLVSNVYARFTEDHRPQKPAG